MTSMRWMLTSKIHRATVTAANLDYVGSIVIILAYSGIDGSQIDGHSPRVVHVDEGNRLTHTL